GQDPRDAREVGGDLDVAPSGKQGGDVLQAAETQFQDQPAVGTEDARGGGCDAVVDFEAGLSGEERHVRLPVADLPLQTFFLGERDIGGVRDDQIHRLGCDGIHEVADDELDAGGQAA